VVGSGRVHAYQHQTGKVAVIVEVACETDFVASNEEFINLCKELALQIASMEPKNVKELWLKIIFVMVVKKSKNWLKH